MGLIHAKTAACMINY